MYKKRRPSYVLLVRNSFKYKESGKKYQVVIFFSLGSCLLLRMIWKAGPLVAQTSRIFIKQAAGCVDRTNWLQLSYRSSGQQATKREGTLAQEAALCLFGFPFYTFCLLPVVRDWLYCMQIGDGYQCSPDWLHPGPVRGEGVFSQFRACTNRGWYQHLPDWLYP